MELHVGLGAGTSYAVHMTVAICRQIGYKLIHVQAVLHHHLEGPYKSS
jgi:hypothetical protein